MSDEQGERGAAAVPVWNVETLRAHITALMHSADERMDERHEAARTAIRVAFETQSTAMQAAFEAQREAVTTAFLAQKEAVNAALAAADRAVSKAELASEKRFESVNEFRATLSDQQRTLFPRAEAEAIFKSLEAKLESSLKSLDAKLESALITLGDKITEISRLQTGVASVRVGERQGWQYAVAVAGVLTFLLGIVGLILGYMKAH